MTKPKPPYLPNPLWDRAQRLARLIPHRTHPHYREAVHRWTVAVRKALNGSQDHAT